MSLQEFAWLGASMSGVGVLASIIYVSIQIRNNTRAVRASAFQQVVNSLPQSPSTLRRIRNSSICIGEPGKISLRWMNWSVRNTASCY